VSENNVTLAGYSGHGFVVAETALRCGMRITQYTEFKESDQNPFRLKYLGFEMHPDFKYQHLDAFILGIGDNGIRHKVGSFIHSIKKEILNVIDPKSFISASVQLGKGNFIARGAILNTLARTGNYCIINTGAIVEHECILGDAVHIAPGAVLAGNVKVGDLTFIGANAVVKQGVSIGKNVIVGAGAVVLKDIADNDVVAGNPAKTIK